RTPLPDRRIGASPEARSHLASQPPTAASGMGPVGRPTDRTSTSNSRPGSDSSRNRTGSRKAKAIPGERAESSRRPPRGEVSREGLGWRGSRTTETEDASAGPSSTFAPSSSENSHALRQKKDRVVSSASTGSEATRVIPSSSRKYALPPWMPRSIVSPADERA